MRQHVGNFAPRLHTETLKGYKKLALGMNPVHLTHFLKLHKAVSEFLGKELTGKDGTPHPSGRGTVVPLRTGESVALPKDLDAVGRSFDTLKGDRRNAAYHLLWYAREIKMGRQPITADTL